MNTDSGIADKVKELLNNFSQGRREESRLLDGLTKNPADPWSRGFIAGSQIVESEGFEPSSKQAIQLLSSRLVLVWFSM